MRRRLCLLGLVLLVGVSLSSVPIFAPMHVHPFETAAGEPRRAEVGSDFNGDGYADLALAVGDESGKNDGIVVMYGSAKGLDPGGRQHIPRPIAGEVPLTAGDFDGDGYADLAVGDPWADVDGGVSGEVWVLYGSAQGLDGRRSQRWSPGRRGVPFVVDSGAGSFGWSVAAGDFGRGPQDDLAIGDFDGDAARGEPMQTGTVTVLYGSPSGLTATDSQRWSPNSPGVPRTSGHVSMFGDALAAGRFSASGYHDLAVGIPSAHVGRRNAGSVLVLRGSANGLTARRSRMWTQNSAGVVGRSQVADNFGDSLAVGQFGRNGHDDLAIGAPGERIATRYGAGAVNILYGSADGLSAAGNQMRSQRSPGVAGIPEKDDGFGTVVAAEDFGGPGSSGYDDLLVAAPQESVHGAYQAGQGHVLFGGPDGLARTGNQVLNRATAGIGEPAQGYEFGNLLGAARFGGRQRPNADAVVAGFSALGESFDLLVLPGSPTGLTHHGAQRWTPATLGGSEVAGLTATSRGR